MKSAVSSSWAPTSAPRLLPTPGPLSAHAGAEFDSWAPAQQLEATKSLTVFARVEPLHKLRLVELLRSQVGAGMGGWKDRGTGRLGQERGLCNRWKWCRDWGLKGQREREDSAGKRLVQRVEVMKCSQAGGRLSA